MAHRRLGYQPVETVGLAFHGAPPVVTFVTVSSLVGGGGGGIGSARGTVHAAVPSWTTRPVPLR